MTATSARSDPLPSWNEGTAKSTIVGFVERVRVEGGHDFIPPSERVAVFDNDGTLWCEFPAQVQVFFALSEVGRLTKESPELLEKPAFKAFVAGDVKTLSGLPKREVFEPAFATHAGMTVDEFRARAKQWTENARHPSLGHLFTHGTYVPMRELLDYLRDNDFRTYIVTGGGVEFVRVVAEVLYGIPPEQVIGSSTRIGVEVQGRNIVLRKLPQLGSFDDHDEKVINIALHIGRPPVFAFGNSDGDLAMLRYALSGKGVRQAWYLHHDDSVREFAYDRDFALSVLSDGLDHAASYGIGVVSMKHDWNRVFAESARAT